MQIRNATRKDIKEIANLMLGEFKKAPFNENATLGSVIKSLEFYFQIAKAYVSIKGMEITGVIIFKTEQYWEGPVLIIEDLAVKENYKNKGIDKALTGKIEKYARMHNVNKILFDTNKKSSAIKFYKKLGYEIRKNRISMEKKII